METLKNEIKNLAKIQILLKDQRKTVYSKLKRTVEPQRAQWEHEANREQLRLMYAAYGLLRGKTLKQIEDNYNESDYDNFLNRKRFTINKLVEQYKYQFIRNETFVHFDK